MKEDATAADIEAADVLSKKTAASMTTSNAGGCPR